MGCCCCSCWNSASHHVGVYDPQHPDKEFKLENGDVVEINDSDGEIEDDQTVSVVINTQNVLTQEDGSFDVVLLDKADMKEDVNEIAVDHVLDIDTSVTLSSNYCLS